MLLWRVTRSNSGLGSRSRTSPAWTVSRAPGRPPRGRGPRLEPPGAEVLARAFGHGGLELEAERRQPGVARGRVAHVDARAAADLEEAQRPARRQRVVDRLAHQRLEDARGARDHLPFLIR